MKRNRVVAPLLIACCVFGGVHGSGYASSDNRPTAANTDTASNDEAAGVDSPDAEEISRILALSDDVAFGEYLAGECASCHGKEAADGSNVPVIHGAEPEHLVQALLEFRAGTRNNSTMALVANGLAEDEIAALAHYLTTVSP